MAKAPRAARRAAARAADKLSRQRLRLAAVEPGGAADRPVEVSSASVVEPHAASMPCAYCGVFPTRVLDHSVRHLASEDGTERRVRVVRVRCSACGVERDVFFRIGTTLPS